MTKIDNSKNNKKLNKEDILIQLNNPQYIFNNNKQDKFSFESNNKINNNKDFLLLNIPATPSKNEYINMDTL